MKYSISRSTPRNMRYAQCQLCGFKQHVKDLVKISDRYNRYYGMLVCRNHNIKTNPQVIPFKGKEKLVGYLDKINPVRYTFATNPNDDRVPSAPSNGVVTIDPLDNKIVLRWQAPRDNGSSPVQGYAIKYSIMQRAHYQELIADTGSAAEYYKLETAPASENISYSVAAINGFGVGEYSDHFYYGQDIYANSLLHGSHYLVNHSPENTYDYVVVAGFYVLL